MKRAIMIVLIILIFILALNKINHIMGNGAVKLVDMDLNSDTFVISKKENTKIIVFSLICILISFAIFSICKHRC